LNHSCTKK